MTVKELIELLGKANQDAVVIMSKDSEGNEFSELYEPDVDNIVWNEDDEEIGIAKLTAKYRKQGYGKEDVIKGVTAIVLWPSR